MSSKLKKAIGAVKDHTSISLAKVSGNTSTNLEVAVLKATTHDDATPINEKHVAQVLRLISSNKIYAVACARAIGKRIGRTRNWVVVLKSLMLVLRIFQDGDPYFPREVLHAMKRGARILNLATTFRYDSNSSPWDFTSFVRTVALYLDERLECFLTGKLQRRYIHSVSILVSVPEDKKKYGNTTRMSNGSIWDIKPAMMIDKLVYWQRLLERAIATKPKGAAKSSMLVKASFYTIVRESFDLYQDISDGLALVLDSFFHLPYQNCVAAFQICLKAVKQFKELEEFYIFCKQMGVGRIFEYPSVQVISEELIENLQEFLKDQSASTSNTKSKIQTSSSEENTSSTVVGMQQTLLEDLISVTETEPSAQPFAIDIEVYSPSPHREDAWVNDTASTRSLPVQSIRDLMEKWPEKVQHDHHQQQQQKQRRSVHSSVSSNWEGALVETLAPPLSDNFTNTFSVSPKQPPPTKNPVAAGNALTDLVMVSNKYNPFLQDSMELYGRVKHQRPTSPPTFQATPMSSAQNLYQTMPFAVEEKMNWNNAVDQQKLVQEQQLWAQNQRKIIGKNLI